MRTLSLTVPWNIQACWETYANVPLADTDPLTRCICRNKLLYCQSHLITSCVLDVEKTGGATPAQECLISERFFHFQHCHTPQADFPIIEKRDSLVSCSVRTHPVYRLLECYSASHYNIFISHLWKGEADASDWRSGVWLVCGALRGILWFFSGVRVIWQAPREWGLFHDQRQIHIFILGKITFGVLYQHKFL